MFSIARSSPRRPVLSRVDDGSWVSLEFFTARFGAAVRLPLVRQCRQRPRHHQAVSRPRGASLVLECDSERW